MTRSKEESTMTRRFFVLASFGLVALAALSTPTALAQGGGAVPPGTIYFTWSGLTWTMDGSGGNKTSLPAGVSGEPSRLLHGGQRWFLTLQNVPGTYPDGGQRKDLFAIRGDGGSVVQLTNQADLEPSPFGTPRWTFTDSKVSWIAGRWVGGNLVDAGIYSSDILFGGGGDVIGLASAPTTPLIPGGVFTDSNYGLVPEIRGHDWSPDGVEIVYATDAGTTGSRLLYIADSTVPGGAPQLLPTSVPAADPNWSPTGAKIVFQLGAFPGNLYTINPDGSGQKLIVKAHSGFLNTTSLPRWSANGAHVVYMKFEAGQSISDMRTDVYRAKADGNGKTNLTADIATEVPDVGGGPAIPVGWR
jgi:hypothetical protein